MLDNENNLNQGLTAFLDLKNKEVYVKSIHTPPVKWQKVIDSDGGYFVGWPAKLVLEIQFDWMFQKSRCAGPTDYTSVFNTLQYETISRL